MPVPAEYPEVDLGLLLLPGRQQESKISAMPSATVDNGQSRDVGVVVNEVDA